MGEGDPTRRRTEKTRGRCEQFINYTASHLARQVQRVPYYSLPYRAGAFRIIQPFAPIAMLHEEFIYPDCLICGKE